jgi:ZIP family zinc transporter
MSNDLLTVILIAGSAALASLAGGLLALWRKPTTLFMSIALGFASGALFSAIAFEMIPRSLELGSLTHAVGGFAAGFAAIYGFDLFIHRGRLAGEAAEQKPQVERFYHWRRPRGGEVTVLAGGTSAEELIEGLSIGVGASIQPGVGLLIGLAIAIDNLSEGLGIGEIIRSGEDDNEATGGGSAHGGSGRDHVRRILMWTGAIGAALFVSSIVGWLFLRNISDGVLSVLFAAGAGGMFYLTVTDLLPQAEEHHYQQSGAIATGVGFMLMCVLSELM